PLADKRLCLSLLSGQLILAVHRRISEPRPRSRSVGPLRDSDRSGEPNSTWRLSEVREMELWGYPSPKCLFLYGEPVYQLYYLCGRTRFCPRPCVDAYWRSCQRHSLYRPPRWGGRFL